MKKRHAALAALALVGILSGCGQAETQPADNTIAIAPVEKKANTAQVDMSVKYDFSGNNADANGIEIQLCPIRKQRTLTNVPIIVAAPNLPVFVRNSMNGMPPSIPNTIGMITAKIGM